MTNTVYFKNLNGFRFIAASMVIVCHLELFKDKIAQPNHWRYPLIFEAGSAGVDFFFVLSGFLITSLLLVEHRTRGRIDLKKFYLRRILRIWPLYFLIVGLCFFLIPHFSVFSIQGYSELLQSNFSQKLLLSILLLPNAALAFFGEMPYCAPIWSVGVEEQFYLFWPLLLMMTKRVNVTITQFIVAFIAIKIGIFFIGRANLLTPETYLHVKDFLVGLRMECMGLGGLGAYLFHRRSRIWHLLSGNRMTIFAMTGIPVTFYATPYLFELHHIVLSIFFIIIILNGATNERTFIHLEQKLIFNLGTVSYGLYLWHPFCLGLSIFIMRKTDLWQLSWGGWIYYAIALSLTSMAAYLSYYGYEQYFLRLKTKFTVVVSGNLAQKLQEHQ